MALLYRLREIFIYIAGIFCLLTLFFDLYRGKWKRFALDIFVCFIQMPLWIILGIAVLRVYPELIYSYFSGIWLISGVLLWVAPHSVITAKAIRQKAWLDAAHSAGVILAIIAFGIFTVCR